MHGQALAGTLRVPDNADPAVARLAAVPSALVPLRKASRPECFGHRKLRGVELVIAGHLFNDTATTEIYTLSLHDALPIYLDASSSGAALEIPPWCV